MTTTPTAPAIPAATAPATPAASPTPVAPAATTPVASPLRTKIEIAIAIALIVFAVISARTWIADHDARIKAEASVIASQKAIEQAAADKKQLIDEQRARDEQTETAIEKIAAAAAAQKTPQQITNWIPAQAPELPVPIKASIAPATPENPTPPAIITVPQADLGALRDQITSCQKNAVALPNAQQDLSSCQARAKLSAEQLAAAQDQVKALELELKGGTFWHRLKSGAKKVGIGVAIGAAAGAVAMCETGHCK